MQVHFEASCFYPCSAAAEVDDIVCPCLLVSVVFVYKSVQFALPCYEPYGINSVSLFSTLPVAAINGFSPGVYAIALYEINHAEL